MANFDNSDDIINFLKDIKDKKNISQKEIYEVTKISEDTLTRYFNNETKVSLPNLLKICKVLNISVKLTETRKK
ncbi:helix-turn-helix domain-containing protein [Chryseobacterium aquaticum]|uniref:HTH cro/C1-type domain-containing protein n=1 Tax=Chryseobacterium aquaticum subsp. greenlandense TaxID=345663 RepID=A0A101CHR8_9FLAO|nr:helix-turn-helix transcriptional regulator [Chryseobacterium aquaticum]KUJ56468.1 hypothetical protein AR686_07855 [Chryseobacterium aquaticum subsp. greenlandense]